ncbi:MAG: hypothetical protein J6J43_07350 [Oscillospiraceae bacterium]|nr:hypothetical protein [Oscillospiraceae bacterium]
MTDFSKFRSALSGFNRSDVANYIEALSAEHQKQLKAEKEEREAILEQLNAVRRTLDEETKRAEALEQELAASKTALEETQKMLEEALSMEPDAPQEDYHSLELEAYRRAEAMERSTCERAAKVRQQLGDLVEETAGRYEQVGQDIKSLSEDLGSNLQRLQEALSELDAVFDDTTDRFDHLDTEGETEE